MFEMIDEKTTAPERKKMLFTKAVIFVVAVLVVAGVIYFLAFPGVK